MFSGTLFIVSAPSGAGKSSLVRAVLEQVADLEVSISHTTRPPRPGEQDGVDYYFVSREAFERMVEQGAFLEYATVFDNMYGSKRSLVEEKLRDGIDVIMDMDWQGARQVREAMPGVVSIYVLPPSLEALRQRLEGRGQDSEEVIERRMRKARDEIAHFDEYDYLVINDDFDTAVGDLERIIRASRLRLAPQRVRHAAVIEQLLE